MRLFEWFPNTVRNSVSFKGLVVLSFATTANFLSSGDFYTTWYRKGKRPHLQCRQLTKCQKVGLQSHDFVSVPLETRHGCDEDQILKEKNERRKKMQFLKPKCEQKREFGEIAQRVKIEDQSVEN